MAWPTQSERREVGEGDRKPSDAADKEETAEERGRKERGPSIDEIINEEGSLS